MSEPARNVEPATAGGEGWCKAMCGRVIHKTPLSEIRVLFETMNAVSNSASNYNGAPTQQLPVVRLDEEGRRSLDLLRWGLIPFWAKDPTIGMRCINAMAETASAKPAFRDAFRRRRCLVPVDGFYEWQKRHHPDDCDPSCSLYGLTRNDFG